MEEILQKITNLIETYESGVWVSAENLTCNAKRINCK